MGRGSQSVYGKLGEKPGKGGKEEGRNSFRTGQILLRAEVGFQVNWATCRWRWAWALLAFWGLAYHKLTRA